jgi:hypothetical protein
MSWDFLVNDGIIPALAMEYPKQSGVPCQKGTAYTKVQLPWLLMAHVLLEAWKQLR